MHRLTLLILTLCLLAMSLTALADTPQPITTIPYDELPPVVDGQTHLLLLCVDVWNGNPSNLGNTDGMVLVTLDRRAGRVMLTSFIRDALVNRPTGGIGRINYIAHNSGPEALCRVISEHIGVRIEQYILFDFSQIQAIIDSLGGVTLTITGDESAYLTRYAIPRDSTTPRLRGEGTYLFDGHAAVIYMRIRKTGGGGDFMRTQRVRTVLSTLADKCRTISYEETRMLANNIMEHQTMTNLNLDRLLSFVDTAYSLRDCTVEELRIPPDGAVHPINYAGMAAQELDWEKCREAMRDYLENSFLVMDESSSDPLEVTLNP